VSVTVQDEILVDDVDVSPQTQGYGQDVSVSGDVSGRVGLSQVRLNVTYPNGTSYWFDMSSGSGDSYSLVFGDTWQWGNYSYVINATNLAGFSNSSGVGEFYVRANTSVFLMAGSDLYGSNKNVSLERQEWWNTSFSFRERVNVSENSGSDLTDYQVNMTIDTQDLILKSRLQGDCSDVRFAEYNESSGVSTELSYWFDSDECDTVNTTFWVKVPNLPGNGYVIVHMYYGGSVESESNISSAFVFGDDFSRPDSGTVGDGWTEDYPDYASIEDGMLRISSGVSTGTYQWQVHHSFAAPGIDYVMEYTGNASQEDKYVYSNYFGTSSNRRYSLLFGGDGVIKYLNGSTFEDSSVSYSGNVSYGFRIWYKQATERVDYYIDDTLEGSDKRQSNGPITNEVAFGGESGSTAYWDDVRIRKKASQEPTFTLLGEESLYNTIGNLGEANQSGYLLVEVQNAAGGVVSVRINDSDGGSSRNISAGLYLNISSVWDSDPWNTDSVQSGFYRIYAAFTDPWGNVLVNDSGDNISVLSPDFYIDTEAPRFLVVGLSEDYPKQGDYVDFYVQWQDNYNLGNWTFSWNASGSWENSSTGSMNSTLNWSNATLQIPVSAVFHHGFRFYAEDQVGNTNVSDIGIFTVSGRLEVQIIDPIDSLIVAQNVTFHANATVVCREGTCGNVNAFVRYNQSSQSPDTSISTSPDTPFYAVGSGNPESCSGNPLGNNEFCNITWNINATGDPGESYMIGVLLQSDQTNVQENHTGNNSVTIISCIIDITVDYEGIGFGGLSPGERGNASGNNESGYNTTVEDTTTCAIDLYLRSENLTRKEGGDYHIPADSLSFSNTTNEYNNGYSLSNSWVLAKGLASPDQNITTYYWIDTPFSIMEGEYNGTLYIEAVEGGDSP